LPVVKYVSSKNIWFGIGSNSWEDVSKIALGQFGGFTHYLNIAEYQFIL